MALNGSRVVLDIITLGGLSSNLNIVLLSQRLGHIPGIVHVFIGHIFQLRAPLSDVLSIGIKLLRLQECVEHKDATWADS